MGTVPYMSPEQVSGLPIDVRTDLYAVGLMLFEMLTGTLPFSGDSALATALARVTQAPLDIRSVRPGLPEPIATLVMQCLSQRAEERPPSAAEVGDRLRAWLASIGESLAPGAASTLLAALAAAAHSGATTMVSTGSLTPSATTAPASTSQTGRASSGGGRAGMTQGGRSGSCGAISRRGSWR